MAEFHSENDTPFFSGSPERLQVFARWIDDFERAAICRVTPEHDDFSFAVDLQALNRVLAVAGESLDGLNPIDAQRCGCLTRELQRDVAAILAGGLTAILGSSVELQEKELNLRRAVREASPYIRWLGVRVRDELASCPTTSDGRNQQSDQEPEPRKLRTKSEPKATVNERMAGEIMENPETMGWNSPQWARHLKCARSTVVETAAWKKLESARFQAKAEQMKDRRRKPKASDTRRE